MPENTEIDLRAAVNAISDVVQNRPRPLREFDQIYMKAGDMVLQSEMVARWSDKKRLAFIGDGDAISVCVAYLRAKEILPYGPAEIMVFDFDERMLGAVARFAEKQEITTLRTTLSVAAKKGASLAVEREPGVGLRSGRRWAQEWRGS